MSDKLTPKEELFAQKVVELNNQSEAYRKIYKPAKTTKEKSIWESASTVMRRPHVAARVKELRAMHLERHKITVDGQVEKLQNIYEAAFVRADFSPAVSAVMGQSKHCGLLIDKQEHTGKDGKPIEVENVSESEILRRIAFLFSKNAKKD